MCSGLRLLVTQTLVMGHGKGCWKFFKYFLKKFSAKVKKEEEEEEGKKNNRTMKLFRFDYLLLRSKLDLI